MRAVFRIAAKDLRLRVRDRSAFILGIIAPFVLALIFSLVLGDLAAGTFRPRYGVVDEDGGVSAAGLVATLRQIADRGLIELERDLSRDGATAAVEDGELAAVFVVPSGFTAAVEEGSPATVEVLGDVESPTSVLVARSIARSFATEVETVRLAVATAIAAGADPSAAAGLVARVTAGPPPVTIAGEETAVRELDLTTFFVASMAIFFLFFTVQFGVTSLLEEKQDGTMSRLLAAPIRQTAVVWAKLLVSFVLGVVSMTVLIVASTFLLGAEWGNPVGVALLVVCGVLSAMGITTVVIAFARSTEQAGNLQAIIAVGLGMLGGVFFPAALGTGLLADLAYVSPHRWFLTGLSDLAGGGGVGVIVPSLLGLLAFAVATGGLAAMRLRKVVLS